MVGGALRVRRTHCTRQKLKHAFLTFLFHLQGQKFLVWVHTADGFYAPPADKTVEVICTLDTNPVEVTQTMGVT